MVAFNMSMSISIKIIYDLFCLCVFETRALFLFKKNPPSISIAVECWWLCIPLGKVVKKLLLGRHSRYVVNCEKMRIR
ncbi:MAG: hypothetical protein JWM28_4427 [Chitinophagaceae bacterium]|nr:hypothetical protein [Chitinophagaceae bacterium]